MPSDSRGTKRPRRKRKGNKPTRVRRLFRALSDTESEEIIPRAGIWSLPVQLPRAAQQQEENTPAPIEAAEQAASAQALGAPAADNHILMAQTPSRAARDPRLALHCAAAPTGPARALVTAGAQGQALLGGAPQQADNLPTEGFAQGQMENLAAVELPQPQGADLPDEALSHQEDARPSNGGIRDAATGQVRITGTVCRSLLSIRKVLA